MRDLKECRAVSEKSEALQYQERILEMLADQRMKVEVTIIERTTTEHKLRKAVHDAELSAVNVKIQFPSNKAIAKQEEGKVKTAKAKLADFVKLGGSLEKKLKAFDKEIAEQNKAAIAQLREETPAQKCQRDHEREMKIIDHEIARENRLAAEAAAKVAATAQEQASQSVDSLLKGLQGDGKT